MLDTQGYKHTLIIRIAFPQQQWLPERTSMLRRTALPYFVSLYRNLQGALNCKLEGRGFDS